jgi:hypothetical protein
MADPGEMSPMPVGGGSRSLLVWCEGIVLVGCKGVAGMPLPVACGAVGLLLLLLGAASSGSVGAVRTVAIVLVFVAGLAGAFLPWRLRSSARMLARGNSLSAGVMLAAGLIHLLGDAASSRQHRRVVQVARQLRSRQRPTLWRCCCARSGSS